jgi:hypothetical protein
MAISVSDMHSFVENMDSGISLSRDVGNVIDIGNIEELGSDLGAGLLSNTRSSPKTNGFSMGFSDAKDSGPSISILEPLEAISFDIPASSSNSSMPDISVNREVPDIFSNYQTASGPSINALDANRISPEEERKKKVELINKLNRLQTKGYNLTKKFTMDNTLEEVQTEYDRLLDAKNLEASLRFQRQCMMGVVTGAEFLNGKFNPFDWELDGWSESVHENIEDFDEVFEELYDKYKNRGTMPPEAKLMMSLVGSGFMFHMSNSFFRSKMSAMDPNDIFRQNPQLAKQFAAAAAQQAGPGFGNFMGAAMGVPQQANYGGQPFNQPPQMPQNFVEQPRTPQPMAAAPSQPVVRNEMRGPQGMDDILKTFQEVRSAEMMPPHIMVPPSQQQQPARQAMSELSSLHSMSPRSEIESTVTGSTGQRRGRRKVTAPVGNMVTLDL